MENLLMITDTDHPRMLLHVLYESDWEAFAARHEEEIANTIRANKSTVEELKAKLDSYFGDIDNTYDRLLFLDLCRLNVDNNRFDEELVESIGSRRLNHYRKATVAMIVIDDVVKEMTQHLFHEIGFLPWREEHAKTFLQEKRVQEKASGTYARPYIDHLDKEEKRMFNEFWNQHRSQLINTFITGNTNKQDPYTDHFLAWNHELSQGAHQAVEWHRSYITLQRSLRSLNDTFAESFLATMRSYKDLNRPLWGRYRNIRNENGFQLEKHLAAAFYPLYGFGYNRSYAYRQATTQGSIFKIVTAYTALIQRYHQLNRPNVFPHELNPLTMIDRIYHKGNTMYVGETMEGKAIPRIYRGGRLPRSLEHDIGTIDITRAIETSSNPYFALLAGDVLDSPWDLATSAEQLSYGKKTGIDLPGEIAGNIPNDLDENKTGLYSFSIGHHSLVVTPLQAAVMLSAIANGGKVLKPKFAMIKAGHESDENTPPTTPYNHYSFEETLSLAGVDFPLFTATVNDYTRNAVTPIPTEIKNEIPMPQPVRTLLMKGMEKVVTKIVNEFLWSLSIKYRDYPQAIDSLKKVKNELVGKTSSAECMEAIDLDRKKGVEKSTHEWFGGIAFEDDDPRRNKPELVVVIYLRFGNYGKDASPIAAQIVEKWREIKNQP